jgi:hypothetical protein
MSEIQPSSGHSVNWPTLAAFMATLAGGSTVITWLQKARRDRRERKSKERQAEIEAAVQPIIDKAELRQEERHEENRGRLDRFEVEQAKMIVKVDDLWERRRIHREEP